MAIATIWDTPKPLSALHGLVWGYAVEDEGEAPGTAARAPWYKSPLLWVGGIMLVLAAFFLTWVILKPPPPVTMAEMEAARKAREEFGTQGPAGP